MTDTRQCQTCGAPLPDDAPAGLCPTCLVKAGLESATPGEPPDGPRFEPPSIDALTTLFPKLEILQLLGTGGMGAVYKARQPALDRVVALKALPPEIGGDPAFTQRFAREAQALARLNHPHIVAVYEYGQAGDTSFIVMEYVDGASLRHTLETGALEPMHALVLVPQICDALQYAHDEGVVHRDIKLENILLDRKGRPKVADVGLSKLTHDENHTEASLTGTHQVMGTLRYMAPEQMEGTRNVDHRADIYSLGVVFYEMLTGELPIGRFQAPSQKVAVDVRLDDVVLRALAKEPERRYQHASDVKTAVESIAVSEGPPLARTIVGDADRPVSEAGAAASLQHHELAGRLLLTRRQLMERVKNSLRPLFRWQILQILIGVALIVLGVQCWARNTHVPHRLICGLIVHVYGVLVIGTAAHVCTKIKRIDYSKPVDDIRNNLGTVRTAYLRFG
ncbi:MAG: serine/threonine-protein kinase, partial [Vicinamibacterales bacterium]|nr:serine/threonine-protein kinase [Vicinamibacterales bacterium]